MNALRQLRFIRPPTRMTMRVINSGLNHSHFSTSPPSEKVNQLVQDIATLNLMEVSQLVEALKTKLKLPDTAFAAPVAQAAAPAAAEVVKEEAFEKPIVNLKLESFNEKEKIKVIKEVKSITGLGLKDSKTLVDSAPAVIKEDIKREDAAKLVEALEKIGAKVSLE